MTKFKIKINYKYYRERLQGKVFLAFKRFEFAQICEAIDKDNSIIPTPHDGAIIPDDCYEIVDDI